jgi:hypothetical protein
MVARLRWHRITCQEVPANLVVTAHVHRLHNLLWIPTRIARHGRLCWLSRLSILCGIHISRHSCWRSRSSAVDSGGNVLLGRRSRSVGLENRERRALTERARVVAQATVVERGLRGPGRSFRFRHHSTAIAVIERIHQCSWGSKCFAQAPDALLNFLLAHP